MHWRTREERNDEEHKEKAVSTSYVACYVVYSCRKTFKKSFTDVIKKSVLKNFATFTGKYRRWSLILIKLQELKLLISLKKTLPH